MADFATLDELKAALPDILTSPQNNGELRAIVIRPKEGERQELKSCDISLAGGVHGDHWANGCWMSTDDDRPHPDVQVCIMNARCIEKIAKNRDRWRMAGDNFFVDLDLRPENLPTGQRLQIGTATIEITSVPHQACGSFVERYGRDAATFVNVPKWHAYRLRGIYARVVQDGHVRVGDRIVKID